MKRRINNSKDLLKRSHGNLSDAEEASIFNIYFQYSIYISFCIYIQKDRQKDRQNVVL